MFCFMRPNYPWRLWPDRFLPRQTVYRWFAAFRDIGQFEMVNHALVMADREWGGGVASPSAAILDRKVRRRLGALTSDWFLRRS